MSDSVVAMTCTEVLAVLSDYLDGDLDAPARAAVEAHLAGCDNCTRFGGEFAAVVTALRQRLGQAPADAPADVLARVDAALGPH